MNDPLPLLLVALFAPLVAGVMAALVTPRAPWGRTLIALAGPVLSFAALVWYAQLPTGAATPAAWGLFAVPELNLEVSLIADPLGLFFAGLIAGVGALIVLFARAYFGPDARTLQRFYTTLGLFTTAMLGVVLSDNFLVMLVFWELTSVSSFLLIGWNRDDPKAVRLALQALATTGLGGLALLGGLLVLGVQTGAWAFSDLAAVDLTAVNPTALVASFVLIFLGCATKSAQWPFHFWLPGAMAAPTPVSAFLHSATMVKAGVYLFGRLFPVFSTLDFWAPTLIVFGGVTMLLGAYIAVRSDELKKIFAYTTVSQLGLFTAMYGLGALATPEGQNLYWPVTQILNHALYKAPLFIMAGAVACILGKKYRSQLRGLLRTDFVLAGIMLLALYALAAGPGTLSFTAKEAFLEQVLHGLDRRASAFFGLAVVATAACNTIIFVRFLLTFLARTGDEPEAPRPVVEGGFWGAWLWLPALILLIPQYVLGFYPEIAAPVLAAIETNATFWGGHLPSTFHAFEHPSPAFYLSLTAYAVGAVIAFLPVLRRPMTDPHDRLFPAFTRNIEVNGAKLFFTLQGGNFRTYCYFVLFAILGGLAVGAIINPELLSWSPGGSMAGADLGLVLAAVSAATLICVSAIVLPIVRSRIVRVMVLGVCGFSVTAMYLLYQAPDLALTQLMFELISVILFLLVLRMLPEEPRKRPRGWTPPRVVTSLFVGVAIGWLVLQIGAGVDASRPTLETIAATHEKTSDPLAANVSLAPTTSPALAAHNGGGGAHAAAAAVTGVGKLGAWATANAYEGKDGARGGGGENVVNVILVDTRGYDTLGEITVLSIAAIGVFAMIGAAPARSFRRAQIRGPGFSREAAGSASCVVPGPQPSLTSSLFQTAMRVVLPLGLIFAAYMFFRGHDEPGGGFIAGLVASVAIAVYRMAKGRRALTRLLPIKPAVMASLGLAIALSTAVAPLIVGFITGESTPFLTSNHSYIPLAGGASYHWTSVALFDLGVFIVVVAVSVGMLNRLTEELE